MTTPNPDKRSNSNRIVVVVVWTFAVLEAIGIAYVLWHR